MADRQSWWPYLLALVSALLAPSAVRHALEQEPNPVASPGSAAPAPVPGPLNVKAEAWDQFVCSYFYPKQETGYCPDPNRVALPLPVEYLIAGVPDPEATSLPATFDVMVESLLSAAAAEGWAYDRNWLPWGLGKGDDKRGASPEDPALTDDRPGLLLFRKTDRLLLIFLVGETPTSGVSKTALLAAARFILARSPQPVKLRILGPRFSGSVPSYRRALEMLREEESKAKESKYGGVHFVSGSATREANLTELQSLGLGGEFRYEATIEHDARTQELFLGWLETRGIPRSQVAILAEGGTAFGASFRPRDFDRSPNGSLRIEFPYQISRLRNAYEKDPELRAIWMGARTKEQSLEWSLKTEREGTDRPRTFQGPQTTLLQERQVEQLVETIRLRKIRAIGINATDILDTVFLTLLLRRNCPDARLFTLDSDLLFTYASGALSFNGLLMVSPYPLWLESHRRFEPKAEYLSAFSNRSSEGVYNAFIKLTGGTRYRDYWSPAGEDRPPIWVTTVGRRQVVPLAILGSEQPDAASQLARAGIEGKLRAWTPKPDAAYGLALLGFGALVFYGAWVYGARRVAELGWRGPGFDPAFHFVFDPPDPGLERTLWVQVMCAFGVIAMLPFTVWGGWWLCGLLAVVFVLTTLAEPTWKLAAFTAAVLAALVAAQSVPWLRFHQAPLDAQWERLFFEHRVLRPLSGVSPLPSWVLSWFGCAWWAIMKMNQVRTRELRSPRLVGWPPGEPLVSALDRLTRGAYALAESVVTPGFVVVLTAGLLLMRWSLGDALASLEPETGNYRWTQGVFFSVSLLAFLVLMSATQLFQTHGAVTAILNALVDHPLGDAFERLPRDLSASQLWLRGSHRAPFQSSIQGVKRLRELANAHFPGAPDFVELFRLERMLGELLDTCAAGRRPSTGVVNQFHEASNRIGADLYPVVAAGWQAKPLPQQAAAEEFIALRLAALVRYLVMQMRSVVEYMSLAVVVLILSIISYPLAPQNGLVNTVAALVSLTGVTVIYVITRLDRHPVMQKFSSRDSVSFGETLRKLAAFGFAPLVATLTALFPGSVRNLSMLIEAAAKYLGSH